MNTTQLEQILAALIRMEHKTTGSMTTDEYSAAAALSLECGAPSFITEYFAGKANQ